MRPNDQFDVLAPNDIRLKGTRVGIETILHEWLRRGRGADEIARDYPTVSLEQVNATIAYYRDNQEQVDRYLAEWDAWRARVRAEQRQSPSPWLIRMGGLLAQRQAASTTGARPTASR